LRLLQQEEEITGSRSHIVWHNESRAKRIRFVFIYTPYQQNRKRRRLLVKLAHEYRLLSGIMARGRTALPARSLSCGSICEEHGATLTLVWPSIWRAADEESLQVQPLVSLRSRRYSAPMTAAAPLPALPHFPGFSGVDDAFRQDQVFTLASTSCPAVGRRMGDARVCSLSRAPEPLLRRRRVEWRLLSALNFPTCSSSSIIDLELFTRSVRA